MRWWQRRESWTFNLRTYLFEEEEDEWGDGEEGSPEHETWEPTCLLKKSMKEVVAKKGVLSIKLKNLPVCWRRGWMRWWRRRESYAFNFRTYLFVEEEDEWGGGKEWSLEHLAEEVQTLVHPVDLLVLVEPLVVFTHGHHKHHWQEELGHLVKMISLVFKRKVTWDCLYD